jgi:NAD(P)-dependent dehydrogenase (short-subunit alcohol dehydrogenase family)
MPGALVDRAASELGGLGRRRQRRLGRFDARRFEDVTEADVDRALGATVKGSFFVTQAAVPHLRESVGSWSCSRTSRRTSRGRRSRPRRRQGSAGDADADAWPRRSLRRFESADRPRPGGARARRRRVAAAARRRLRRRRLARRCGRRDLYLAGAGFVTGTTIAVDGGRLLQTGSSGHA